MRAMEKDWKPQRQRHRRVQKEREKEREGEEEGKKQMIEKREEKQRVNSRSAENAEREFGGNHEARRTGTCCMPAV